MFSAPLQHITVAELTSLMAIAHAVSAKFKEFFISGQLKLIPLFRYSVFRVLPTPSPDPPSTLQEERGPGEYSTTFL